MTEFLITVGILIAIGAVSATVLAVASHYMTVHKDGKATEIRECLPGINCGACGYSGCDGYAKALSDGKTDVTNACVPGGDTAAKEIA